MLKDELKNFIERELKNINSLKLELESCKGNSHTIRRAKGSILHDFYNGVERIFELITENINGKTTLNGQWHKRLLYQMTAEIKDIRPIVISNNLAAELDEYLSFRHLFRNIYGFELDSNRLDVLIEKFPSVISKFENEIKEFISKL
jgi:hypothetical protein